MLRVERFDSPVTLAIGGVVLGLQPIQQLLNRPLIGSWSVVVIGFIQLDRQRGQQAGPDPSDTNPRAASLGSARSDDRARTIPVDLMPSTLAVRRPGSESNASGHTCQVSRPVVYSQTFNKYLGLLRPIRQKASRPGKQ